jgi:hypothetical protein
MKRLSLLFILISFFGIELFAQKVGGFGTELSIVSFQPNYRLWISRTTGFEAFGGVASELEDFKPNDFGAGFKFLHTIIYNWEDRTYLGILGKWKYMNLYGSNLKANLPVYGLFIGKEWYSKRIHRKGFAIELGYQFGTKDLDAIDPTGIHTGTNSYTEFPLILNIRYSIYSLQ